MRADHADGAADHLRLRARYAGGDGALLVVDAAGRALRLELDSGKLAVSELSRRGACGGSDVTVHVDAAQRSLSHAGQTLVAADTPSEGAAS